MTDGSGGPSWDGVARIDALVAAWSPYPKPSAKLPAGSPLIGSKKPGGSGSKRSNTERGYRVASMADILDDEPRGETFSTPDMALHTARRRAKAAKAAHVIYRHGKVWQTIFGDGSAEVHEDTQP